jgi:hypothetical protein
LKKDREQANKLFLRKYLNPNPHNETIYGSHNFKASWVSKQSREKKVKNV